MPAHGKALADSGYYFESTDNDNVVDGVITLSDYVGVDWILGRENTIDETFSSAEQTLVTNYLDAGGAMLITGEELGWDLELAIGRAVTPINRHSPRTIIIRISKGAKVECVASAFVSGLSAGRVHDRNSVVDEYIERIVPCAVAVIDGHGYRVGTLF